MTGTKRSSEVPISVLAESRGVGVGGVSLQVRHTLKKLEIRESQDEAPATSVGEEDSDSRIQSR